MSSAESFDVVIAGSGAGGAPVALALARAGARVLVLDKGRQPSAADLVHDEVRMCRRDFFSPRLDDEPHTIRRDGNAVAEKTREGWTSCIVGGGTVHYSGFFFRMKPIDFRLRTHLGAVDGANLVDWPIGYDALEPYYARIEREVGVSGRWKSHPFEEPRSADYPLPPLDEHPFAARIDGAAAALGVHPFPTPRAIASRAYRGRDKCAYCRRCGMYGCPVGAKGSTLATLLPMAVSTGRCEVRARAMATEVAVDERGRARAVIYRDAEGKSHRVEARCIVVACSAIESARLLLSSQSKRFPRGLANGSGLVGKNLLFDAGTAGLARFGVASRPWLRGRVSPFVQRAVQDFYELAEPRGGVKKGGTLHFLLAHANPIAAVERVVWADPDRPLWGRALKERLRSELQQSVTLQFEVFSEFYANDKTYVDLDPEVRDRFGQPVARITLQRHPLTQRTARLLGDEGVRILKALGPDEAPHQYPVGEGMFLQGGTCRFGTDPAASVLDRDCRAHEVPNLYVTDGSFLPTTGGAPPTMTIMANALRVAAVIAERLQSRAL